MDSNDNNSTGGRPAALENASETQLEELERQYDEGDRDAWNTLVESYGWSAEDGESVWTWFGEKPDESGAAE